MCKSGTDTRVASSGVGSLIGDVVCIWTPGFFAFRFQGDMRTFIAIAT